MLHYSTKCLGNEWLESKFFMTPVQQLQKHQALGNKQVKNVRTLSRKSQNYLEKLKMKINLCELKNSLNSILKKNDTIHV